MICSVAEKFARTETTFQNERGQLLKSRRITGRWSTGNPQDDENLAEDSWEPRYVGGFVHPWVVQKHNISQADNADLTLFSELIASWHRERGFSSSDTEMAMCKSYQGIIAMGREKALPLILRRLECEGDEPDHWFWALEMLAKTNPVPKQSWGNMAAMAKAWLEWAVQNNVWY
jgi:hypothetical protein